VRLPRVTPRKASYALQLDETSLLKRLLDGEVERLDRDRRDEATRESRRKLWQVLETHLVGERSFDDGGPDLQRMRSYVSA
jgi:hypothetical protein